MQALEKVLSDLSQGRCTGRVDLRPAKACLRRRDAMHAEALAPPSPTGSPLVSVAFTNRARESALPSRVDAIVQLHRDPSRVRRLIRPR